MNFYVILIFKNIVKYYFFKDALKLKRKELNHQEVKIQG